jgi:hypothetical protein
VSQTRAQLLDTSVLPLPIAAGSVSAPSIYYVADSSTGIYFPGSGQFAIATAGTQRLYIDSSGRVGIGTTSPGCKIDIISENNTSLAPVLRVNSNNVAVNTSLAYDGLVGSGQLTVQAGASAALIFGSSATERARIDSSGLVGIGTSSPGSILDIRFSTNPLVDNGNGFNVLRVWTTSALAADAGGAISFGGVATSGGAGASWAQIAGRKETATTAAYGGYLQFAINNSAGTMSERMRLDSSGRLGIGTSSPTQPLQVSGNARIGSTATATQYSTLSVIGDISIQQASPLFNLTSADGTTRYGYLSHAGSAGNLNILNQQAGALTLGTNNTEYLRITSSGNVGIGTTSPAASLDVFGNLLFSASNAQIQFNTGGAVIRSPAANTLTFLTDNTAERARIDSSGRLLVGTSSARSNFSNTTGVSVPLQLETASESARFSLVSNRNDVNSSQIIFAKSRGTVVGSNTIVSSGDTTGLLSFQGSDGTEFVEAARIHTEVDGTPGANDMPGRLVFSTTANGAASPTERLRITSTGALSPGATGTNTGTSGQSLISQGSSAPPTWGTNGKLIQTVTFSTGAVATGTTVIPYDNTIPRNTDGNQYMSLTITPTSASSLLCIQATIIMSTTVSTSAFTAALFQDSTANALAAVSRKNDNGWLDTLNITYWMTAGTTSATTFKIRAGTSGAGTTTFNGISGGRYFGGVSNSNISIMEVTP